MLKDLVKTCRSYRRFFEDVPIPMDDLRDMVDTARLTASARLCAFALSRTRLRRPAFSQPSTGPEP